ncbi:redox-sensing transcriptional repressor Rex [Porphyromonadaceae bacterium W3.11]|nr:redox-sensing transcriptional repressor Rex [Porphyromonadaceae bacterium W3.11]
MNKKKQQNNIVSEPALRRLPWYLAYVKLLNSQGEQVVSSTQIARSTGVEPALVAKDLSYVSLVGKTRVGYDVKNMIAVLEDFLGFNRQHKAFILGVGNLGAALLQDKGLSLYGMDIIGGYDISPDICGTEVGGVTIKHMDQIAEDVAAMNVKIGIITVPVDKAQEVTDKIVSAGIENIWNFTPFRIIVPDDVVVQNTSIYSHLAVMFHRIREAKE